MYSYYPFDPRVRKEAEALAEAGHEVDVIAVRDEGERAEEIVRNVRVHRISMKVERGGKIRYAYQYMLFFALSSWLLLRLHAERRFEVIHTHSLPDFQVFSTVPERVGGCRVILDLHEAMPEILAARFRESRIGLLLLLARGVEWTSAAYANSVIVTTQQRLDLLSSRGVDPSKMIVVMNSPDRLAIGSATSDDYGDLDRSAHWVLAQAGGLNPERDLETLVSAAGILGKEHSTVLILVGRGEKPYKDRLKNLAAQIGPGLDLRLLEWVPPDLAFRYVQLTQVGVVTYERNPLTEIAAPHKVLDYVAAEKPLVLADLSGLRAMWGDAALYYEPGQARDLAMKLRSLLEDPSLSARLVSQASRIYRDLDWNHSQARLLETYHMLGPCEDATR